MRLLRYCIIPLLVVGWPALAEVIDFIIALYLAVAVMFGVHLILIAVNGLNPFRYVKNVLDALVLAFTSRSSLGTLPVSIEKLTDNVGLDNGIATFVGSLGSNAGMNGCAGNLSSYGCYYGCQL